MIRRTEASGRRRYSVGDTVKVRIVLDHKPHLKEVRLVFAHESDERATIMAKSEPSPRSGAASDGPRRSSLEAEIAIPRGRPSGIYRLDRVGYETAGGRLGHLDAGGGPLGAPLLTFEVAREPADVPIMVGGAFVDE